MASEIKVDTISEKTSAAGVTIDGLLIKDGAIPSIAGGKVLQVVQNEDEGMTSTSGSSTYVLTTTLDTITPTAAGSSFLVQVSGSMNARPQSHGVSASIMYKVNSGSYQHFKLDTSSSSGNIQMYDNGSSDAYTPASVILFGDVTYSLTDTITFALHIIGNGPGSDGTTTARWGHTSTGQNATNSITIMEIAG